MLKKKKRACCSMHYRAVNDKGKSEQCSKPISKRTTELKQAVIIRKKDEVSWLECIQRPTTMFSLLGRTMTKKMGTGRKADKQAGRQAGRQISAFAHTGYRTRIPLRSPLGMDGGAKETNR
jgi:hypothetical protein